MITRITRGHLGEEIYKGRLRTQPINKSLSKQEIQTGPKKTSKMQKVETPNTEQKKVKIQAANLQNKPTLPLNKLNAMTNFEK